MLEIDQINVFCLLRSLEMRSATPIIQLIFWPLCTARKEKTCSLSGRMSLDTFNRCANSYILATFYMYRITLVTFYSPYTHYMPTLWQFLQEHCLCLADPCRLKTKYQAHPTLIATRCRQWICFIRVRTILKCPWIWVLVLKSPRICMMSCKALRFGQQSLKMNL